MKIFAHHESFLQSIKECQTVSCMLGRFKTQEGSLLFQMVNTQAENAQAHQPIKNKNTQKRKHKNKDK